MAALIFLVSLILIIAAALFIYQKIQFTYWAKKGVKHDTPHILFGNFSKLLSIEQGIFEFLHEQYHKYRAEPVSGFYGFTKPVLIIRDLDLYKDVTIKDFASFENRSFRPAEHCDSMAARVMFCRMGDSWRTVRHRLTLAFTSGRMKAMYPRIDTIGEEVMNLYSETVGKSQRREIDVRDFNNRFTTDVITACAFGSQGNAIKNPKESVIFNILRTTMQFSIRQAIAINLMFFARPLYKALGRLPLGISIFPQHIQDSIHKIVSVAEKQRLAEKERKGDIFDQIIYAEDPEFQGIANKAAHSFQMLIGGSETTATTTTFTLYELAKNPHVQDRLRKEIEEAVEQNDGKLDYDVINNMEYLNKVVKEALRMWPVLPFLDRVCQKEYHIAGTNIVLEKGAQIFIPIYSIQRDPLYHPNPDKFDPERFSKENIANIPEMAYTPFGAGPRYCVGKRFGLLVVKTFICRFLRDFEVRLTEETSGELQWNRKVFTLFLKNGMKLAVSPVNK